MNSFWIGMAIGIIIGIVGTIMFAVLYVSSERGELEDYDLPNLTDEEKESLREEYSRIEE